MAKKFSMAALLIVAATVSFTAVQAQQQPTGLLPAGSSSLPAGQYMMTNISTGQSYYIFINSQGQLLAQDPRALQVNVMPLSQPSQPSQAVTTTTQPASGGGFGGMLKQGLDSYLQNRMKPAPQQ